MLKRRELFQYAGVPAVRGTACIHDGTMCNRDRWQPTGLSRVSPICTENVVQPKTELSIEETSLLINSHTSRTDVIAFRVKCDTAEITSINNQALGMLHARGMHAFSLQVLERLTSRFRLSGTARLGEDRTVSDLGWKNTVLACLVTAGHWTWRYESPLHV